MPHRNVAVCLAATLVAGSYISDRAMADEVGFPCDGCVVVGEPDKEPRPLLVVLHGDEGGPSRLVGTWRSTAGKAKVTLFAPKCPRSEGCVGSWWQWDGSPSYLLSQVAKVEEKYAVDPDRRYLGGWSGGSTYLTLHLDAWFPTFAAVSVAGGGAPRRGSCFARAGGACAPVHYMMGDRNPLFNLAEAARDAATACGHDVTWELLPGADHEAEWRAYSSRTSEVMTWLLARSNGCAVPAPLPSSVASSPRPSDPPPAASSSADPPPSAAAPPRVAPGCTCEVSEADTPPGPLSVVGLVALATVLLTRRTSSSIGR